MPHGKIAGFDRPLAESELILETALRVDRELGENLEDEVLRDEKESIIEERMGFLLSGDVTVKLSPAGFTLGVQVALGTDEVNSEEIDVIESAIKEFIEDSPDVDGFALPTGFKDMGAEVDEMEYSIQSK